jgi:hypothetical protein
MKMYRDLEAKIHTFLTLVVAGVVERASSTDWVAGWMDFSASLDMVMKSKVPVPARIHIQQSSP